MDNGESGSSLHYLAKRHASIEKLRRAQQNRYDGGNQHRSIRYDRGPHVLLRHETPLPPDIAEALVQIAALLVFAAKQGDALTILPDARKRVAKLRFNLVLDFGNLDEVAGNEGDGTGCDDCIDNGRNHEKAGDRDPDARDGDRESPTNRPQDNDKGRGRHECSDDT
ncbi:hypothetical protein D3C80_1504990 [compost metagenome]